MVLKRKFNGARLWMESPTVIASAAPVRSVKECPNYQFQSAESVLAYIIPLCSSCVSPTLWLPTYRRHTVRRKRSRPARCRLGKCCNDATLARGSMPPLRRAWHKLDVSIPSKAFITSTNYCVLPSWTRRCVCNNLLLPSLRSWSFKLTTEMPRSWSE